MKLLTPLEVEKCLKVSRITLARWRSLNIGPKWVRLGDKKCSRVRYTEDGLKAFLAQ
jgi:hypothetical protein